MQFFKLWYFLATGFGIGRMSRVVPVGTIASLVAIPIWWVLVNYFSYNIYYIFLLFVVMIGIYLCEKVNEFIGIHDDRSIVWDEFIGMWITLIAVPMTWFWVCVAFVLFRLFDIIKPWPISWFDKVIKNGFGVIIDDVLASIISMYIIIFFIRIFP